MRVEVVVDRIITMPYSLHHLTLHLLRKGLQRDSVSDIQSYNYLLHVISI